MRRLVVSDDAAHRLGGAVPSPAAAFLLAVIALPALFWLVMLKRTTVFTAPEEWLMSNVQPAVSAWVQTNLPPLETLIIGISALGSGWFVALGFAVLGLLALANGRRDLALLLALGTLCFPMEWALKYFTSSEAIDLQALVRAIFNVNDVGLDDIADFPGRPRPARHGVLRARRLLRGAPRPTTSGRARSRTSSPRSSSAPSARRASTSARTTRSTCSAA